MIQRLLMVTVVALLGVVAQANTADFNALTAGTIYLQGSMFSNGGLDFDVLAGKVYIRAVGPTPTNPSFNGNYLNMPSNVEVKVNLPTGASQIQFDFLSGYDWGLRINGGIINRSQVPGTINGVAVTKTGNGCCIITAAGSIESFALIGTEFWVDNLVADLTTDLAGDYNFNGVVDGADYVVWRKSDGTASAYATWRENFGVTAASGSGTSLVPEPCPLLLAIGCWATCFAQWRKSPSHNRA
jgi:hypothetical protein